MRTILIFSLSAFFHILILYSMTSTPPPAVAQKTSTNSMKINVIEKARDEVVKRKETATTKVSKISLKHKLKKKKAVKKINCKDSYNGIGITKSGSCVITRVFKGYPADKAGLLSGDLIISPDCGQIRGPEGSTIHMKIMRGSHVINLDIVREKICGQINDKP
jgi:C-terminal processing protease CtpA/Prc